MAAKKDLIKEEKKAEKVQHHLQEEEVLLEMAKKDLIKEEKKAEKLEHHLQEAEAILTTVKNDHIKEETRTKIQNVPIKSVIKADLQVERIVTHASKKNHHLEIVHLTEKVVVDVAHPVNVVQVQGMI